MNLANILNKQARLRPDGTAVHLPTGTLSFRQLDDLTWRAATFLHQNGVRTGDVIALIFAGELALLVTMLAAARIGSTVFSIPKNAPSFLRAEMAKGAGVRFLATDCTDPDGTKLPHLLIDIDALSKADAPLDVSVRKDSPQAPWLIITGSGSTGRPKLFSITQAQFYARISLTRKSIALSPNDRLATLVHLDFTSPKERCLSALSAGAAVVLFDRHRMNPVMLCREYGVSVLDATVFHLEELLAALPGDAKDILGSLRVLLVSASTVSDGLRRRVLRTLTKALYVRYGTNESGILSIAGPQDVLSPPGTVGRPPAGVSIETVDANGQVLPPGKVGQLRVKSPGMIDRYLDDEKATQLAFAEGWFLSGDLGRFVPDGNLIFCGRADLMMIMNGINIYPAEIEQTITRHPAVLDAAAIPLRSTIHQDIPVCAVVLQDTQNVTEKELLEFASQRLGSNGPKRIVVLDHIPRNEQGKLMRLQLMQDIAGKLRTPSRTEQNRSALLQDSRSTTIPLQLPQKLQINLSCPEEQIDLKSIDDWLRSVLAIEIGPWKGSDALKQTKDSSRALMLDLVWRILLLMGALLQAARIPAFDPGRVLGIEQDRQNPSNWTATVAIARIDHISPRCYEIIINAAIKAVFWVMGRIKTPENVEILYNTIEKQAIRPLQKMIVAGKSTIPLLRVAYQQNIPFSHLGAGVYQLGWGSKSRRLDRSTTELDSAIGAKLAQNKVWSADLIRMAGLPAPHHRVVATKEDALRLASHLGWPVVVKPPDRDRGEGVTVGVANENELFSAFEMAVKLSKSKNVIIERQVEGVCHRLFIANGQLLYAVKRLPKSVKGDGRRTVAELIQEANQAEKNRPPWLRSEPFPSDALTVETLRNAGFSLGSVPPDNTPVPLRKIESTRWGGVDKDVTDCIHPDNLDIALRAATIFGLYVAGIDIITPDISKPWHVNGAIINEVNFAPLFGGGEISRNNIPIFFNKFIDGDGRIPIEVFVGGDAAMSMATKRQKELIGQGTKCALTSHKTTLTIACKEMHLPHRSLYKRCKALLMNDQVEAVVLVVQTDEFLYTGLPIDRIEQIKATSGKLTAWNRPKEKLPQGRIRSLLALLRSWEKPTRSNI